MNGKSIIINDDNKIYILEKYDEDYEAEAAINLFATLIKAPEGIHTYQLDEYSLWSAAAIGFSSKDIIDKIQIFSKNIIPQKVISYIEKIVKEFWTVNLYIGDDLTLKVNNINIINKLINSKAINKMMIKKVNKETFLFNIDNLSELKQELTNLNIFIEEIIGDYKWVNLDYKVDVDLYEYQKDALKRIFKEDKNFSSVRGVVTMPPGAGKTIIGLKVIEKLKVKTLILVKDEHSYKNWIEEIKKWTNLPIDNISYNEENDVFINIFTYKKAVPELNNLQFQKKWGLIIYDDARQLATPTHKKTAFICSKYKLATDSLLDRPSSEMKIYKVIGPKLYNLTIRQMEKIYGQIQVQCKVIKLPANYWKDNYKVNKIHAAGNNLNKIDAARKIINEHNNSVLVSYFKDIANKFASELENIEATDGGSKIEERDEVVKSFNDKCVNKIIITEIVENLRIKDINALIAISFRGESIRDEYIRIGKIKSSNELFSKKIGFYYALITKDTIEESSYKNVMIQMVKHGYRYNILNW